MGFSHLGVALFLAVQFLDALSLNCDDLVGGISSNDVFCQTQACSYCNSKVDAYLSFKNNYVNQGYCRDSALCRLFQGTTPAYNDYCGKMCKFCARTGDVTACMQKASSFCRQAIAPSCSNYVAWDSRLNNFCQQACSTHCKKQPDVAACMESRYSHCRFRDSSVPPTPKPAVITTTKKTPIDVPSPSSGCWAPGGWSGQPCQLCPNAVGNQCPKFSYTGCFSSEAECGKGSGGGSACAKVDKENCPTDTSGIKRASFKGPNCYNDKYGAQFGPSWKPSGKTGFEKYVKNPTEFYKLLQTVPDEAPLLKLQWGGIAGCKAAAAVYENFVCSIELLEATGKTFEAPPSAPGGKASEFANNGDEQIDRLEIASFLAHKFKETGRLMTWEENPGDPHTVPDAKYPATAGQSYHGRGPVQISYNFNYGAFSEWFFGEGSTLLNSPDMVDPEGPMGFIAALWFWFTPRDFTSNAPIKGRLRTRDAIVHWKDGKINAMYNDGNDYDSHAGLSLSTNVINGGIECAGGDVSWPAWRVGYFMTFAARLGLTVPDTSDMAACLGDKYCKGLFVGCSLTAKGLTCEGQDTSCGATYVSGWLTNLCK